MSGVKAVTEELKAFASEIQNTTAFGDGMVLEVSKTLAVLGVQEDQLKESTKTVLDFASATGKNAVEAAVQLGKTLGGSAGELVDFLPQLRGMNAELLKSGAAFDLVENALGGFAEGAANTVEGLTAQAANAFGDLQKAVGNAINPVRAALTEGVIDGLKQLTALVNANREGLTEFFRGAARSAIGLAESFGQFVTRIPEVFLRLRAGFTEFLATAKLGSQDLALSIQEAFLGLQMQLANTLLAMQGLPLVGDDLARAGRLMSKELTKTQVKVDGMRAGLEDTRREAEKVADEYREQAAQAQRSREEFERTGEATSSLQRLVQGWNQATGRMRENLAESRQETERMAVATSSAGREVDKINQLWAKTTGITPGLKTDLEGGAAATERMASGGSAAAGALANANSQAAGLRKNLEGAAAAGASAGGGGGSGGGGGGSDTKFLSESRTVASRTSLDFSDPFRAAARAQAAQDTLRDVQRAGSTAFLGRTPLNAAIAFARDVTSRAQASVDAAIADFSRTVLNELNRSGVTDPQQRSRQLSERVREAQRLGILPEAPSSFGVAGGIA